MAKGNLLGEIGRRDVLRAGLIGLGGGIAGFGAGPVNEAAAATPTAHRTKIPGAERGREESRMERTRASRSGWRTMATTAAGAEMPGKWRATSTNRLA